MSPAMTLFSVQAVLILSTEDGSRIFAKYYSPPHSTASAAGTFEAHPAPRPIPPWLTTTTTADRPLPDCPLPRTPAQTIASQASQVVIYRSFVC